MTPTFYQICTRKKHLNGRSSLIKHNMIMNYIPLDSSFQCVLLSRKNFTSIFSFNRNSQKTKKLKFLTTFGSHTNKWGLRPVLSLCLTSTYPLQLTAISFESATKIFFEKTMTYLLSNLHPEKTFKRP
jgi:hypothetical protein